MEMRGEYVLGGRRQDVWDALNDPNVLKACLPGCESLERMSDTEFKARLTTKVGPIKTNFACSIELSDIDPPTSYTLSGQGDGGASGHAKGSVKVFLREDGDNTILNYVVEASLRGKIGQMGSRVVDSIASAMADEFFKNLSRILGDRAGTATTIGAPENVTTNGGKTLQIRSVAIAVIIALVLFGGLYFVAMRW